MHHFKTICRPFFSFQKQYIGKKDIILQTVRCYHGKIKIPYCTREIERPFIIFCYDCISSPSVIKFYRSILYYSTLKHSIQCFFDRWVPAKNATVVSFRETPTKSPSIINQIHYSSCIRRGGRKKSIQRHNCQSNNWNWILLWGYQCTSVSFFLLFVDILFIKKC